MFELVQLSPNCYQINSPSKIGLIIVNNKTYIVDSGSDKEAGRKIRQVLDANNLKLDGILNTHCHADHIGGNHYLQNKFGCKIFANTIESTFIENTLIGPSLINGGFPPKDMLTKLFYNESSDCVSNFDDPEFPDTITVIPLPGHSPNQVGYITEDNIAYIGDAISSKETLNKYHMVYIYNVQSYLDSLNTLETLNCNLYVPSHLDNIKDIKPLCEYNRNNVYEIINVITNILKVPMSFEKLMDNIFDYFNIQSTISQIYLLSTTVKSYLSYLKDQGKIETTINKAKIIYKTI